MGKPKVDDKPKITVPPIPEPPTPPRLADIDGLDLEKFDDHYPLYFPKGSEPLFAHLDKSCFHVTDGRYFGLLTASIADPQFVGPLAPGVTGNFSQGTALNTACSGSGGGSSGGALQATPQVVKSATNISAPSKGANAVTPKSGTKKPSPTTNSPSPGGEPKPSSSKKKNGPTITASSSELRKIMEEGGELAEKIKKVIIRSAVHASRAGKHGISFRAPNGQTYPDVSKAFAVHAGLKPCNRCKNNKQGVSLKIWHPCLVNAMI